MPLGPVTADAYLRSLDDHLATLAPEARASFLEDQIRACDHLEMALSRWAARGGVGNPPTMFSAFDLGKIALELSKRLANEREAARQTIAAE